jgi:hypothetical protein
MHTRYVVYTLPTRTSDYILLKFRDHVSAIPGYALLGAFGYGHLGTFDREINIEEILQMQDTNSATCPKDWIEPAKPMI